MKQRLAALALALHLTACGGDGGGGTSTVDTPPAAATPPPSPAPPPPAPPPPAPTPPADPPPSMPNGYLKMVDLYTFRFGSAGITLQSGCGGFAFAGEPPAALPVTAFGQGLTFRYISTPGVWAIGGEVTTSFDGRDGVTPEPPEEMAFARTTGGVTTRLSIIRPVADGVGLDYVRLAAVSAPVQATDRRYQCVLGVPTLTQDYGAALAGAMRRTTVLGTAYVSAGGAAAAYGLGRSTVSIETEAGARRVTVTLRLIGTLTGSGGGDVELGTFEGSAATDPETGNFTVTLATANGAATGTLSGHFFGPAAVELGAALSVTAPASANTPAYTLAGAVYGMR